MSTLKDHFFIGSFLEMMPGMLARSELPRVSFAYFAFFNMSSIDAFLLFYSFLFFSHQVAQVTVSRAKVVRVVSPFDVKSSGRARIFPQ